MYLGELSWQLAVPCLGLTASACLVQQKVGVFAHATLEVLVLSRCWFEDYGESDLVLRYTRRAPSVSLVQSCGLVVT